MVLVPITMAVGTGARLTGVPETVTAGAPGVRVWVSTTMGAAGVFGGDDAPEGAEAWVPPKSEMKER
jgi:hypothetical protein